VKSAQLDLPHPSGWTTVSMFNRLHLTLPFQGELLSLNRHGRAVL